MKETEDLILSMELLAQACGYTLTPQEIRLEFLDILLHWNDTLNGESHNG
jgi:hypothetical protein